MKKGSHTITKLESIVGSTKLGAALSLGSCALKGLLGNAKDLCSHTYHLFSEGFNSLKSLHKIPTDWYITPEHFALIMGGSILGGLMGSVSKKQYTQDKVELNPYESCSHTIKADKMVGYGVAAAGIGLIAKYVFPEMDIGAPSYITEFMQNFNPSFSDLLYFAIPAGLVGGVVNKYNKDVSKQADKEREEEKEAAKDIYEEATLKHKNQKKDKK